MLSTYIFKFETLDVKQNMSYLNKPILLLTIMEMVENYLIYENRIIPNEVLFNHFYQNWIQYAGINSDYNSNCWDPFCGLIDDGFWHLEYKGDEKESAVLLSERKNRTEKNVKNYIYFAKLDEELFHHIQDDNSRKILQNAIIQQYIGSTNRQEGLHDVLLEPKTFINVTAQENSNKTNDVKDSPLLDLYCKDFTNLHISMKHGGAPHKPVLLLALLTMLDDNILQCNEIYLNDITKNYFRKIWDQLVGVHDYFQPTCWLPFLYLKYEDFWHFEFSTSEEIFESLFENKANRKESMLKEHVRFAYFDDRLFELLEDSHKRDTIRKAVIEKYFNNANTDQNFSYNEENTTEEEFENVPEEYKKHLENCDDIYIQYNLIYFKKLNVKKKRKGLRKILQSPIELYKLVHDESSMIDNLDYDGRLILVDILKQVRMALDEFPSEVVMLKKAISKANNTTVNYHQQSSGSAQTSLDLIKQIQANKEERLRRTEEEKLQQSQKFRFKPEEQTKKTTISKYTENIIKPQTYRTYESQEIVETTTTSFITHNITTSNLNSKQKAVLNAMKAFHEPAYPSDIFRMVSWSEWGESSLTVDSVDSVLKTLHQVQYIKWGKYILKEYLDVNTKNNEQTTLYKDEIENIEKTINNIKPNLVVHEIYKPSFYGSKWSSEDDENVKISYSKGTSIPMIAKLLGRTIPSIIFRLNKVIGNDWVTPGIERNKEGYFIITTETIDIILHSWDCLRPNEIEILHNTYLVPLLGKHCTISLIADLCRIKYEG